MDKSRPTKKIGAKQPILLRFGAPGEIRTPDPLVRSQVLYPTELRARNARTRIMRRPRKTVNFRVIQKLAEREGFEPSMEI